MMKTLFPHWSLFWVFYFLPSIGQFPTFSLKWTPTKNLQTENRISPTTSSPAQTVSILPLKINTHPKEDVVLNKFKEKLLSNLPKVISSARRVNKWTLRGRCRSRARQLRKPWPSCCQVHRGHEGVGGGSSGLRSGQRPAGMEKRNPGSVTE